jgi:archaemetzincin
MRKWIWLSLFILLVTCAAPERQNKVILLLPFADFPVAEAQIVLEKIRKINPDVILRPNVAFPTEAYYKPRNRYRADIILKYLRKQVGKDTVVAGLSGRDISTTKGDVNDWGVMGLGYRPGNACVISTFRLSSKNRREQFYKVVLHELGHTQGLPHCTVKTCLMRDAEGGNPLDAEKDFCKSCKSFLAEKHWKLKN